MSNKVYSLEQLEELASGSDEFVQSMIETFLEHTPQQLQEMLHAHQAGDLQTVGGVAHKIKPNIDLFQINAIVPDIRAVEEKGKDGINDEQLRQHLARVEEVLNECFKQMREL